MLHLRSSYLRCFTTTKGCVSRLSSCLRLFHNHREITVSSIEKLELEEISLSKLRGNIKEADPIEAFRALDEKILVWPLKEGQYRPGGTVNKKLGAREILNETVMELIIVLGGEIEPLAEINQFSRLHFAASRYDEAVTEYGHDCAIRAYKRLKEEEK